MYYPALTLKIEKPFFYFLNTVLTQIITLLLQRKLIKKTNIDFCELRSTKMPWRILKFTNSIDELRSIIINFYNIIKSLRDHSNDVDRI